VSGAMLYLPVAHKIFSFNIYLFSANFERTGDGSPGPGLVKVDIRLDTGALLDSMVQQARMVVFKAVAKATAATDSLQLDATSGDARLNPSPLSGFSSALNLSSNTSMSGVGGGHSGTLEPGPHEPAHRLQKAKSSALKLGSVLSVAAPPANASFDMSKKTRSVQWDARMEFNKSKLAPIPSPKRQKMGITTARLTSFKSFGRPHAGDFGSGPKNATFGDFGRKPIWGRDGKLANHPSPMLPTETTDILTSQTRRTANATFDFQKPSIHLSSGRNLGITTKKQQAANMQRVPSSIPRTATALEGWLIEKTGGGNF
jgi:hypothetical protein